MRTAAFTTLATAMLASLVLAPAPAAAKTAKDCRAEWQADKVAMKAAGKTEKAYVAECRGNSQAAATPAPKKDTGDKGGY